MAMFPAQENKTYNELHESLLGQMQRTLCGRQNANPNWTTYSESLSEPISEFASTDCSAST